MDKVVGTVEKNALERIQIAVKEYHGHLYIDVRLWFLGDDEQWHPTKKGITVSPDQWDEFMTALGRVATELPTEDRRPRPGTPGKRS